MRQFLPLMGCIFVLGCAAPQVQRDWEITSAKPEFQKEKAVFKERLGGKAPCVTTGLSDFMWESKPPTKECLYPPGPYSYSSDRGTLVQNAKILKVLQAMPNGFLVQQGWERCDHGFCYEQSSPNLIFIYKTDEQGIVDGSYLDEIPTSTFYEYAGPFSYKTSLANKTVHSFRKIPLSAIQKAHHGLKVYNFDFETLAKLDAWLALERASSNKK